VLAAGAGRRMGGTKALLVVDGVALVQRHLQRLHEAGCRTMAVVVRPDVAPVVAELVGASLLASWVRVVAASTDSQASSLAVGLRALLAGEGSGAEARGAALLVTPVDMLPPKVETVGALLAALQGDVLAATPLYRGRGGHPVAVRGELLAPYLSGGSPEAAPSLRDVLLGAAQRRVRVEVEDAAILGDLDTPSDVRAAHGGSPVFLEARAAR
jgi:CTP:molybdopterin cytidylyltransferase MocA